MLFHRLLPLLLFLCLPAHGTSRLFQNLKIAGTPYTWFITSQGKITHLGSGKGPEGIYERIDLGGRYVLPGITDAHAHLFDIGRELFQADLKGTRSAEEAVKRVSDYLKKNKVPAGKPIIGSGWDQTDWPGQAFPSRERLDKISSSHPIILYRVDGHAAWVNTLALKKSALWDTKADPAGGKIHRDTGGMPTGILIDSAMKPLAALIPPSSEAELEKNLQLAVEKALSLGITGIHDAAASGEEIRTIRRLLEKQKVRFRFYEMISASDEEALQSYLDRGPERSAFDGQFTVRTVKLFADGAMGSRGAHFEKPYEDDPSNYGLARLSPEQLEKQVRRIDSAGFQVAVHAIGTYANKVAIDVFEKVFGTSSPQKRPRLEHAQVLHPQDIQRIAKLGIVASMQPVHCTSDMKWVVKRIGSERARYAYAWRSLLDAKAILAFGSDAPVESLNPWHGVFAAATRQTKDFQPPAGFFPEQRISVKEAFEAFTSGAAYASFSESTLGGISIGKFADFIVSSENPLEVPPARIHEFSVEETYLGAERVWKKAKLDQVAG